MGILRADRVSGLGGANAIKGSVRFNGNQDDLQLLPSSDFNFGTGDYTIEAWVYPNEFGRSQMIFAVHNADSTAAAGKFYFRSTNKFTYWSENAARITSSTTYTESKWYHVALVNNSGTQTIYVDGTSQGTSTYGNGFGSDTFVVHIGRNAANNTQSFNGYISNIRVTKGTALYTSTFTPPTTRLIRRSDTVLLACNSASNVLNEETGKVIQSVTASTNNSGPQASKFTPNSPVGFSTTTDVGSQYGTTFDGFGSFATSTYMVPPGGNTRERNRGRGIFADGDQSTDIEFINIQSMGHSQLFGDSTTDFKQRASVSSSTRTVTGGGFNSPNFTNILDFITISNTANATDFGDLTLARRNIGGAGNSTRGIFFGGGSPSVTDTIDFITIATTGNASDFGNTTSAKSSVGSFASPTRAVFGGGESNAIEFLTIATTGDATDFGDLISGTTEKPAGVSSSTRGLFICGESQPSGTRLNTIQFVTIATTGNAIDFGDHTSLLRSMGACTNSLRAVYGGGNTPSATINSLSYVTITTRGNGQDFGDLITARSVHACGSSDSHGGL